MAAALPNVDVNLITYNNVRTIGETIENVLAQTWPAVSLTVIDNGSDDKTMEVVENYAAAHPTIRIKRNRHNVGWLPSSVPSGLVTPISSCPRPAMI